MKHNVRPIISTFQSQNKTKWAPKETHHTFKTFIDLVLKNPKSNLSNGKQEEMEHLVKQKGHNYNHCRQRWHRKLWTLKIT